MFLIVLIFIFSLHCLLFIESKMQLFIHSGCFVFLMRLVTSGECLSIIFVKVQIIIILYFKNRKYREMIANTIIDRITIHSWEIIRNVNIIYKSFSSVCDSGWSFDYLTQLYICSKVDPRQVYRFFSDRESMFISPIKIVGLFSEYVLYIYFSKTIE